MKSLRPSTLACATALAAFGAMWASAPALAETNTVRVAQQFGLLYLPQHVVHEKKLIEKHVVKAGLPEPKVALHQISGGANINRALLAGSIDMAAAGIGPMLKLWGRTEGKFKAAFPMADMPLKLMTNDESVKKIEDYLTVTNHSIAVPAAKVSIQAVTLQMAAQKLWGEPEKLDHLVVSMTHPNALTAVLSGGQAVKSHFATLPFSYQLEQAPNVHLVASSYDLLGGPHTTLTMVAGEDFKTKNPKTFQAVINAHFEAYDWIYKNIDEAVEIFIKYSETKLDPADIKAMISDKSQIEFSAVPKKSMEYADFLHSIGDIPKASSWKDFFWDNMHGQAGS